jgi:hypothetical protein
MGYLPKSPMIPIKTLALIATIAVLGTVILQGTVAPGAYAQSFTITQSQSNTAFGSSTGSSAANRDKSSIEQENRQYSTVTNNGGFAAADQVGTTLLLY